MEQPPELTVGQARPRTRRYIVVPVFALLSLFGGLFPSFSIEANLYVLLLGVGLMAAGLSSRMPRKAPPVELARGAVWWLVPVSLFIAFEVATYALGSTPDFPTFSLLADPLLEDYLLRSVAYFGWLSMFWAMVRR